MIDIRKQPTLIECINGVLTAGHNVLIKRERGELVVVGIEEQRKVVGKIDLKQIKS